MHQLDVASGSCVDGVGDESGLRQRQGALARAQSEGGHRGTVLEVGSAQSLDGAKVEVEEPVQGFGIRLTVRFGRELLDADGRCMHQLVDDAPHQVLDISAIGY